MSNESWSWISSSSSGRRDIIECLRPTGTAPRRVAASSNETRVRVDASLFRPQEVDVLCGDASKARQMLGWQPRVTFEALVEEMVAAEIDAINHV